jgi:hypothetical protein
MNFGTMICIDLSDMTFPTRRHVLKPWFSLSEFELKWTESCMRWKNRISATRSLFSVQKQKKQEIFPKNWNRCIVCNIYVTFVTYVWSFDVFCLLEQQARLETKSGQIGSQGKPTQTMRLEKEAAKSTGKHFRNPNLVNILTPVIQWWMTNFLSQRGTFGNTSPSKMA